MKEGGKPRDEERRKAGKGKEGKKESHEGFDTQVPNISKESKKENECNQSEGRAHSLPEGPFGR